MISTIHRGPGKNIIGPFQLSKSRETGVVFEFYDTFSFHDWGKLPDTLFRKGEAQAVFSAEIFEALENPQTWRDFSRTPGAFQFRKSNRFGSILNEIGEELQISGLKTHYRGMIQDLPASSSSQFQSFSLQELQKPSSRFVGQQASFIKPSLSNLFGKTLYDYYLTRISNYPRVFPLDVCFQSQDGFPSLELYTQHEQMRRPVYLSEALALSGLSSMHLQDILLKSAWVASYLQHLFSEININLTEGVLRWAVNEEGRCFLVDSIGSEELKLDIHGIQLSKEFLFQKFYMNHPWTSEVEKLKLEVKNKKHLDWKKLIHTSAPVLPPSLKDLGEQIYLTLTQTLSSQLSQKKWFPHALDFPSLVKELNFVRGKL